MPAPDRTTAELLAALCDETILPDELRRLDRLICADADVRRQYVEYLDLHARLSCSLHRPGEIFDKETGDGAFESVEPPFAVSSLFPPRSPLSHTFVGSPLFSYMAATVILCMMLLGGWAYKISHAPSRPYAATYQTQEHPAYVGRITGMYDCRWADSGTKTFIGASTPLEREYVLASGCLEITYKSGSRVILEGPCAYKIESSSGGFLKHGKLTARIEHQGSAASADGAKPQAVFAVKTPTAAVIDLGTEFGVAVGENGDTTAHVFQGTVKVETLGGALAMLSAGESVLVTKDVAKKMRFTKPAAVPTFVRTLVRPIEQLDLLDVIAGGDGMSRRRERGLDPTTGMEDPLFVLGERIGDGKYHPVSWHRLIDGVFIPGNGPMQIDSTGGAFDGFRATSGSTWGSIWPRAAETDPASERRGWIYEIERSEQFMPQRLGMIGVCPNVGWTFDLAAVRKMYKAARPVRLQTVAGLGDRVDFADPFDGMIDLWVIVDGQPRFKRLGMTRQDGTARIDVELKATDRFLTLAVADGGDGQAADWVLFGDPVLKLEPIEKP